MNETAVFDKLLQGGFAPGMLNTVYGEAAGGKTTACLLASIACTNQKKKVVFVDTENGFSVERLKQLTPNYEGVLNNILLFRVNSFSHQSKVISDLHKIIAQPSVGLVVVDTIGCQYRLARVKDPEAANSALVEQLDTLRALYKQSDAVFIVTNQVYSNMENGVSLVGGIIVKNRSKCLIQLAITEEQKRVAILEKHPTLAESRVEFIIGKTGFQLL
ncbi:MAG: DNA repair and recombination protein RadB [Candidatus Woesearchaeota archaeon]